MVEQQGRDRISGQMGIRWIDAPRGAVEVVDAVPRTNPQASPAVGDERRYSAVAGTVGTDGKTDESVGLRIVSA